MAIGFCREKMSTRIERQFPSTYQYEYPCNFAKSNERCDIIIAITHQPNDDYLSEGVYHLNLVPCTCPRPKILRRIESLFRKRIRKQEALSKERRSNCQVHNNTFDVLLTSNQNINSFLV